MDRPDPIAAPPDGPLTADQQMMAGLRELLALAGSASPRKLDLFTCWCCDVLRPYLVDRRSVAAARFADRHMDDPAADPQERAAVLREARAAVADLADWMRAGPTSAEVRKRRVYAHAAQVAAQAVGTDLPSGGVLSKAKLTAYAFGWANDDARRAGGDATRAALRAAHLRLQVAVFRDIVGDPSCPVSFDPRWKTADVVGLARGIYEDRAFERMPLLADALMDAGCDDEHILGHCRSERPHVRGCWVVDLALGKA